MSHPLKGEKQFGEYQTVKMIECFEEEFKQLKRYIYSYSVINVKLYQFILARYSNQLPIQECLAVSLCLMYITLQAIHHRKRQQSISQQSKWKQEFIAIQEQIEKLLQYDERFHSYNLSFYQKLQEKIPISQLMRQYDLFFEKNTWAIYQKSKMIWQLLIFQKFCTRNRDQNVLDEAQAQIFLETFRNYLQQKEHQLHQSKSNQRFSIEIGVNEDELEQTLIQMMKVQTFLPLESFKKKKANPKSRCGQAKFKTGTTIKEMMLMEINLQTISLVERCETYECPYMIFEVPFTFLLAQTLTYYSADVKELYLYHLYATLCRKINKIKNGTNPQLQMEEINDCLINFLQIHKFTGRQYSLKLGDFLKKHQAKMSSFIPVYYEIFSFHAFQKYEFVDRLFKQGISLTEKRKKLKDRIQALYDSLKKYNNEQI